MLRYLTSDDIANNVRMTRALHTGTILIVEGYIDIRIYSHFVAESQCKLIPSNGKDNALKALEKVEKDKIRGTIAIVDSDFWKLDRIKPKTINLFLTDTHDLETMIIYSPALEKVLSEFAAPRKIKNIGKQVRETLLEKAIFIGYFRWISSPQMDNLGLKFKDLHFDTFIDKKLNIDIDKLIDEVRKNSHNSFNAKTVKHKIMTLITKRHDPWLVCSGHDLVQILTIGLKNLFGNSRAKALNPDIVDATLRLAFEYSFFRSTMLYNSIKHWEKINPPFKVLK